MDQTWDKPELHGEDLWVVWFVRRRPQLDPQPIPNSLPASVHNSANEPALQEKAGLNNRGNRVSLDLLDLVRQLRHVGEKLAVFTHFRVDLAYRVQHGGVISATELGTDLW